MRITATAITRTEPPLMRTVLPLAVVNQDCFGVAGAESAWADSVESGVLPEAWVESSG
jgi:hypothetical protein